MNSTPLGSLVQVAKALAHPTRLRILALLSGGSLPVCQITSALHSVASTVSGHLLELRRSGLVIEQRQGKYVYYRLGDESATRAIIDALIAPLRADGQIRDDAALGASIRAMSPLIVCEDSEEATGAGTAGHPEPRALGVSRS